jgi:hypothetical protein
MFCELKQKCDGCKCEAEAELGMKFAGKLDECFVRWFEIVDDGLFVEECDG